MPAPQVDPVLGHVASLAFSRILVGRATCARQVSKRGHALEVGRAMMDVTSGPRRHRLGLRWSARCLWPRRSSSKAAACDASARKGLGQREAEGFVAGIADVLDATLEAMLAAPARGFALREGPGADWSDRRPLAPWWRHVAVCDLRGKTRIRYRPREFGM